MAITRIDNIMQALPEDYLRNVFADRLENTRLNTDDEAFGDPTVTADAIRAFLALTPEERIVEAQRVRIVAEILNWANDASIDDINSIITILRNERDSRVEPEPEPEPEPAGE